MVTTYDIARKTGLNQSTVSRVLSGFPHVNPATAKKVYKACRELNYVPNRFARALKTKRSSAIAVHIPFGSETVLADPFIPAFLSGVSQEAARQGYSVILSYLDHTDKEHNFSDIVKSGLADGVIVTSPSRSDPWIKSLVRSGTPFVIGRFEGKAGPNMVSVDIDNRHSGYQAASFLLSRGHRDIALVTEGIEHISARDFQDGFRKALKEHDVRWNPALSRSVPVTFEAACGATRELLAGKPVPTAIVANTALTVFGALEAVRNAHASTLVLGIESLLLKSLHPGLPRISSPIEDLGREMTAALIRLLQTGKPDPKTQMLYTKIIDEKGRVFVEEHTP